MAAEVKGDYAKPGGEPVLREVPEATTVPSDSVQADDAGRTEIAPLQRVKPRQLSSPLPDGR